MKILSIFNNKGGVGKSTLTYHLAHSLAALNKNVLLVDLDPQCNLTICALHEKELHDIWAVEDDYIEDFESSYEQNKTIINNTRSIHFLLKPSEDGVSELKQLPPPKNIAKNVDIIPGRLSLHKFENKIAERWSGLYQSENLSIRTVTNIRSICKKYAEKYRYDYILIDTSPSLGILNKVIISTVDGFFIPAQPDMFSLYGVRNIGNSLELWQKEFQSIYSLLSDTKRNQFPEEFVQFLGYSIYNAKKYSKNKDSAAGNKYDLAQAHFQYVNKIPNTILEYIQKTNRKNFDDQQIANPIGESSIIHTHNTFPAMAQALKCPMWEVPNVYANLNDEQKDELKENGFEFNQGNKGRLETIKEQYIAFTQDFIKRVEQLG